MVKNHKLALAISDASWSELVRQLTYKCEWYGRELIKIDRYFPSSKRCGNCGHIVSSLPLNIREWECPKCGVNHDKERQEHPLSVRHKYHLRLFLATQPYENDILRESFVLGIGDRLAKLSLI
jgi:hypothetical protein